VSPPVAPSPALLQALEAALLAAAHQADAWVSLVQLFARAHVAIDAATRGLVVDMIHRRVLLERVVDGHALYRAAGGSPS
jgi:hypothetical protein